jgi:hypothetical protein
MCACSLSFHPFDIGVYESFLSMKHDNFRYQKVQSLRQVHNSWSILECSQLRGSDVCSCTGGLFLALTQLPRGNYTYGSLHSSIRLLVDKRWHASLHLCLFIVQSVFFVVCNLYLLVFLMACGRFWVLLSSICCRCNHVKQEGEKMAWIGGCNMWSNVVNPTFFCWFDSTKRCKRQRPSSLDGKWSPRDFLPFSNGICPPDFDIVMRTRHSEKHLVSKLYTLEHQILDNISFAV